MSRIQTFNGIHVSQVAKLHLRILNFRVAPPHIRLMKMWKKYLTLTARTDGV